MVEGRPFFVAGFTPGGVRYGVYDDGVEPFDDMLF
jgi:hypothetical protein